MANKQPATNLHDALSGADLEKRIEQRRQIMTSLMDALKPWLIEFGNWIFGGLIAFNLLIVAPLLTIGLGHMEVMVSIVAFVCALPLDVAGIILLKLTKDLNDISLDEVMHQAFKDANIPELEQHLPTAEQVQSTYKRRTEVGLRYATWIGCTSAILTLLGMIAALWYIAWWVAVVFIVVSLIALFITMNVGQRIIRPMTDEEREAFRKKYQERKHGQIQ
jgi:ABC-type multidrug transport system fused ATPase/permease subunit